MKEARPQVRSQFNGLTTSGLLVLRQNMKKTLDALDRYPEYRSPIPR